MSGPVLTPDLCILGAGSGGLSLAAGAVQMGARVVLVEGHRMGGDCLHSGCVPSKALLAAAHQAQTLREGARFGIAPVVPQVDYAAVMDHVAGVIAGIAPHDSPERFRALGVEVIEAWGRFTSPAEVAAGDARIRARRFVIATGSSPAIPPIPGLDRTPHLTTDTLWDLRALPGHLLILGAGPAGCEMAQAHRRLGARVTLVEAARPLATLDPEIAAVGLARLAAEGVEIRAGQAVVEVGGDAGAVWLTLADGSTVRGTHLLVATGRRANLDRLDLEAGGIARAAGRLRLTRGLRSTSNARVYAIGDAAGGAQFTHLANWHAGLVIRSALFRLPIRADRGVIPAVVYTDPEMAQVGTLDASGAQIVRFAFADSDRARAARATDGLVKVAVDRRGRILGAAIAGVGAGELIGPWVLAMTSRLRIGAMAGAVAAYPTLGEANKRAAGAWFAPRLFDSAAVKLIVRLLARLG